jgi:hypothetical protein
MRKRSKGPALVRRIGSAEKMSGYGAQPGRPSGVVSYVTPVRPPPCQRRSGALPRSRAGRKYCTYICSTW